MTVLFAALAARSLTDQAVMQAVLIATGFVMVLVVLFLIALARAPVWQRDEAREGARSLRERPRARARAKPRCRSLAYRAGRPG